MDELKARLENLVRWKGSEEIDGEIGEAFFPVLKPADWGRSAAESGVITRPLSNEAMPDDAPVVAYALDTDVSVVFINRDMLPSLLDTDDIHGIALACLRKRLAAEAEFDELPDASEQIGARILLYTGSYYAAEAILLPEVLKEAQERLGADFLCVGIPTRGGMMMIPGHEGEGASIAAFHAAVAGFHYEGRDAPISPRVYAARDGEIAGYLEGGDAVERRAKERVAGGSADQGRPLSVIKARKNEPDGDTLMLVFVGDDPDATLDQLQFVVRESTQELNGDETLSGRIVAQINLFGRNPRELPTLEAKAADLQAFLNRQLTQFGFGPMQGCVFHVEITLDWKTDLGEVTMTQGQESVDKDSFNEQEWQLLADAPYLVFLAVAAADGTIDKKEVKVFQNAMVAGAQTDHPIVHQMFASGMRDPSARLQKLVGSGLDVVENLKKVGALLSERMPEDSANAVKLVLLAVGKAVAEASGGFLGFGKKMSKDEQNALAAVFVCLGIQVD